MSSKERVLPWKEVFPVREKEAAPVRSLFAKKARAGTHRLGEKQEKKRPPPKTRRKGKKDYPRRKEKCEREDAQLREKSRQISRPYAHFFQKTAICMKWQRRIRKASQSPRGMFTSTSRKGPGPKWSGRGGGDWQGEGPASLRKIYRTVPKFRPSTVRLSVKEDIYADRNS